MERKMISGPVPPIVFEGNPMPASVRIPGINLPSIQISRVGAGQAAQPIVPGPASQPIAPGQPAHYFAPGQATQPVPPCQAAQQNLQRPTVDEDRHFLLSLLPMIQRMPRSQKLKVKIRFLQAINDVDNENRDMLHRYRCISQAASQGLPDPITGRMPVTPFVMQSDHTYYLVRDIGNKRARTTPESAGTDPHQQFETGHLNQDYAVPKNLSQTAEDAKSHEGIEIGYPQESAKDEVGHVQETVKVGGSQEPVEVKGSQEPVVVGNVEKSVEIGNVQKIVKDEGTKDTVDVGGSKDSAEAGGSKDNVEAGGSKYNVEAGGSKDIVKAGSSKDIVEDGAQENIKVDNVEVPEEDGNLEDNVEVFTTQENVDSSGEPMDIAIVKDEFMLEAV